MVLFQLIQWLNKPTSEQKELRKAISTLQQEQSQLSMVDNFVQHAKIQRKINKLQSQLIDVSMDQTAKYTINIFSTIGVKCVLGLITILNIYFFKNTPVYVFPSSYNFFPLNNVMSYPCGDPGSVSIIFWTMVTNCLCYRFVK